MVIKEVIDNIKNRQLTDSIQVDTVEVENEALAKRVHHLTTSKGVEISIRLAPGKHLHVGDILVEEDQNIIVVDVLPEDILRIQPSSIQEMGEIAHELGNRHLPAQFQNENMYVQYDYLVENLLKQRGIAYTREKIKLKDAFRHIGHHHDD